MITLLDSETDWTFWIAIYGAVLATAVFAWDILKHFSDRPRLTVKANHRLIVVPGNGATSKIGIDVINKTRRPITVVAYGFRLDTQDDENTLSITEMSGRRPIEEGNSHSVFFNPIDLNGRKVLYAWARDATGEEHRSKKYPLGKEPMLVKEPTNDDQSG
ncbi:MAG: hypothetical protein NUW37_09850 [Planctomycetes bacterium]|nr:hypothetical protein [Planctomycetota bacterium]